jgi:hypothetical protein
MRKDHQLSVKRLMTLLYKIGDDDPLLEKGECITCSWQRLAPFLYFKNIMTLQAKNSAYL